MDRRHRPAVESDEEGWIVSLVREMGEVSRIDLARRSGLSKSVLTARLQSLRSRGVLEEVGLGASSGGRPPTLLRLAKQNGYLIAVDLGATHIRVAIANLNAEPQIRLQEQVDVSDGPEAVLARVRSLIDETLDRSEVPRDLMKGMGVGAVGPVDFRTGRRWPVSAPTMPGWETFPIRDYFEQAYGWPVLVDNDVNVMALGEQWAGIARKVEDFLFVKLGRGVGCGIVCRGEVYHGADGWAGEMGHIPVAGSTVPCPCGNTGCLGAIAGGIGLGLTAEELARSGRSPGLARRLAEKGALTAEDLGSVMLEGDSAAADAIRQAGTSVGLVLAGLVTFCNPSLIVLGGEVAKIGDIMLASIREAVYRRSLPLTTRNLTITTSQLGDEAPLIGAAAMAVCELYRLTPWVEPGLSPS